MTSPASLPVVVQVQPTVIKQETLSDFLTNFSDNSELICLGTLEEDVIEISDSSEQISLDQALQELDQEENPFLAAINQATPPLTLSQFVPLSVQQKVQDRQHLKEANTNHHQPSTSKQKLPQATKPGPKFSRNTRSQKTAITYLDESDDGNGSDESQHQRQADVLNDDFSVFLSSQLVAVEEIAVQVAKEVEDQAPFTFTPIAGDQEVPGETSCFLIQLQNVFFERNVKFELHVNLPQFNVFGAVISGEYVQDTLDLNRSEFEALMKLLNTLERYFYTAGQHSRRAGSHSSDEVYIINQLDLFFTSQCRFKNFQMEVDGTNFICYQGTSAVCGGDLTASIPQEILNNMEKS